MKRGKTEHQYNSKPPPPLPQPTTELDFISTHKNPLFSICQCPFVYSFVVYFQINYTTIHGLNDILGDRTIKR